MNPVFFGGCLISEHVPKRLNTPHPIPNTDLNHDPDRYAAANLTGFALQGFVEENSVRFERDPNSSFGQPSADCKGPG